MKQATLTSFAKLSNLIIKYPNSFSPKYDFRKEEKEGTLVQIVQNGLDKYYFKLYREEPDNNDDQKRFFKEVCIYANIVHPTMLTFYSYSFPRMILGLNFIYLMNLNKPSEELELTPTRKMIIMAGAASGTAHIHSCGIVHRKINIDNILVTENYKPMLVNFIHAIPLGKDKKIKNLPEKDFFTAPEEEGIGEEATKLDSFSLGSIICFLVVGKEEVEKIDLESFFKGERQEILDKIPSPGLRSLIEKAWSSDQQKRPTAHQILNELGKDENILEGTDTEEYKEYYNMVLNATSPCMSYETRLLKDKCETGDFVDWYNFGLHLLEEHPEDPLAKRVAIEYLEKAEHEDYYLAAYTLAKDYIKEEDKEKKEKAIALFTKSAEHHHPESLYELGNCYLNGIGVEKDIEKAKEYFDEAGQLGHEESYQIYEDLNKK